ncbi:hypothetical protein METP2_02840 [Methanosarcinales archaeon]|nr:hypothetical protein METP2_02840 [Methanosarcinales archaeon]
MRHYLGELLQALEKSYPHGLTVSELREKFSSDTDDIIHDAVRGKLILYPIYDPGGNFRVGDIIYLDVNGFGLLNQMKMKEAVDTLDLSIRRFNESSDKYSKEMVYLTWAIYTFTIIVVAIPIYEKFIQLFNVSPIAEIVWLFVGVLGIVALMLLYFQFKDNMGIKDTFNNLRDKLNLNNTEQKTGLIELLLIVGSLVVAFKTADDLKGNSLVIKSSIITLLFMIFALFSILYFIFIQSENIEVKRKIKPIWSISFIIAISFSVIMAILLAMSAIKDIKDPLIEVVSFLIIVFAYSLPFAFIIWAALRIK